MRWKRNLLAAALLGLAVCVSGAAQDRGYWRAASKNAVAITGDLSLSDTKVTIDFLTFTVASIRKLSAAEVGAAFDVDSSSGINGALYRLRIPAGQPFLKKNTLCGGEDTQWMTTYVEGHNLHVAFFSGENQPVLTTEAILNTTDLCGIYTYAR
jgi:hypothetical protein